MVSKWYLFVFKVSNLRETAEGTMDLHYLALEKIPHFDEITYYSIVKTPTSTQHNPKTTSTDVGFDTNMTLQPPPHPTPPPHRNSPLALESKQWSVN